MADPIVVHALGVLGIAHKARHVHPAIDLELVANHAHDGYPLARPLALFQHLVAVGLHPHDLLAVSLAGPQRLAEDGPQLHIRHRAFEGRGVAGIQVQRCRNVLNIEVFRDADGIFTEPLAQGLIADTAR